MKGLARSVMAKAIFPIALLLQVAGGQPAMGSGEDVALVAVAANFSETAKALAAALESRSGQKMTFSSGSTGKLFAQISAGAPFDVFLAADQARPETLEAAGLAVPGSRFTYAVGQLVLWSADAHRVGTDGAAALRAGDYAHLALANPKLAPYGRAAQQALERLGLAGAVRGREVFGQNVGQAFALVATANAELGLVAHAQVISPHNEIAGSFWLVPQTAYDPVFQDAVLLVHGRDNAAARAFLAFLKTPEAARIIKRFGYLPEKPE